MSLTYRAWKRFFDLVGAIMLIAFLTPAFFVVALMLLFFQGRPVFFIQVRAGLGEKPFRIVKFRTMAARFESNGADVDAITTLGKFLRRFSLDELPQLANILVGDMSFVGPRPLLIEYLTSYTEDQRKRHQVRPGLTGLSQVSGRNAIEWEERLRLDSYYASHLSFSLDLRILGKSFPAVLSRRGLQATPSETMRRFDRL